MDDPSMPDLSHLSLEEREIIENVLKRQRDEEAKETQISQKADEELDQIDRQINDRKESARRLVGTQDDAICQICQKTKFADGIGHKCFYCQLRSCARCGGRSQSKNKAIWACSLCQKRQQILAKTGKWFQQEVPPKPSSPGDQQLPSPSDFHTPQPPQIICPMPSDVSPKTSNGPQAPLPMAHGPPTTTHHQMQQHVQHGPQPQPHGHTQRSTVPMAVANGPTPRRQSTLQRQPTMEEQRQQQQQPQHPQPNGRDKRMENARTESRLRTHEVERKEEMRTRSRQEENRPLFTVNSTEDNGYQQPQPTVRERLDSSARSSSRTPAPTAVPPAAVPPTPPVSSSRPTEFRRTRSIREEDGRRGSIGVRLDNSTQKKKEKRLHRQLRSMSSSDDEVPSTSEGFAGDEARQRLPNECTSERDLLRYIYSGDKIRNGGRKSGVSRPFFGSVEPGGGRPAAASPVVPPAVIPGEHLAAKIRTYLSHPVTWQPSADQRRLIGHMVLSRTDGSANGDLGLKVVGGRRSDTGRLGAFITRVKPGSVADTVGRLRPGDEVLEWNGTPLQNATFDQVYEVISASKHETQIDLIVCRSAWMPGGDDFLQMQSPVAPIQPHIRHLPNPQFVKDFDPDLNGASGSSPLPHSQSAYLASPRMSYYQQETETYGGRGTIFGRIELALHYSHHDRQLTVMVERAFDLAPRPDGMPRNPYVKIFLLPDRSEYSRRQTPVLAETVAPVWGERFYYNQISEPALFERALEVTVWDYDKLDSNSFLGEVLVDFSAVPLDGAPMVFTLVDMDDENPLRTRLRQRKLSQYSSVPSRTRDDPPRPHSEMAYHGYRRPPVPRHSTAAAYDGYDAQMRRSRTYDRYGGGMMAPTPPTVEEDWTANQHSGYLSDHAHSQPSRYRHRRPRSATAMRHMTAAEMGASRMYSRVPVDDWEDSAATPESARGAPVGHLRDPRSPNGRVLMDTMQEQQGYGSDGSETLSIHSQHSIPVRTINRRPQPAPVLTEPSSTEVDDYLPEDTIPSKAGQNMQNIKERKKSLMTRFIPGRAGEAAAKRTGFARSEEVGIPENLSADRLPAMLKQTSKESTDSGDNWMPVLPDGPLGVFVDNLGPGQVVGRQVLASPVFGELQVALMGGRGGIEVEVIKAHNLVLKPGAKVIPAPYVKAYLMEGKTCVAKAKTAPVRGNTTSPVIRQRLQFNENPRHKMLQLTVLGDCGRMERKVFMGIAQIRLDDVELGAQPVTGVYKLFHSSSLAGAAPVRKDSDTSLTSGAPC